MQRPDKERSFLDTPTALDGCGYDLKAKVAEVSSETRKSVRVVSTGSGVGNDKRGKKG